MTPMVERMSFGGGLIVSALAHLAAALYVYLGLELPTPLPTLEGRSSVSRVATIAAAPRSTFIPVEQALDKPLRDLPPPPPFPENESADPHVVLAKMVPEVEIKLHPMEEKPPPEEKPKLDKKPELVKKTETKQELKKPAEVKQPKKAEIDSPAESTPSPGSTASQGVEQFPAEFPRNPPPPYPADALFARQEGVVLLRIRVDATGKVTFAHIEKSSGVASLDASALNTMRGWLFSPARRGGTAVPFEFLKPVEFFITRR